MNLMNLMNFPTIDEKYSFSEKALSFIIENNYSYIEGLKVFCDNENIEYDEITHLISDKFFSLLKEEAINPAIYKEAEKLYLKTVIEGIIKRIKSSADHSLSVDMHEKAQFYKEFQRELIGIEEEINSSFAIKIKDLKEVRVKE